MIDDYSRSISWAGCYQSHLVFKPIEIKSTLVNDPLLNLEGQKTHKKTIHAWALKNEYYIITSSQYTVHSRVIPIFPLTEGILLYDRSLKSSLSH